MQFGPRTFCCFTCEFSFSPPLQSLGFHFGPFEVTASFFLMRFGPRTNCRSTCLSLNRCPLRRSDHAVYHQKCISQPDLMAFSSDRMWHRLMILPCGTAICFLHPDIRTIATHVSSSLLVVASVHCPFF